MKKRRIAVVAFLLAAVLALGVGFANLTDSLTLTSDLGAVTTKSDADFKNNIYFSEKHVTNDQTSKATFTIADNKNEATLTANDFSVKGQQVIATLTIQNDSPDFNATVTPNIEFTAQHEDVFTVTCVWLDGETESELTERTINGKGGTATMRIVVTLNVTPIEAHTADLTVTFGVAAVAID